jgi:hypothetical protein
VPTVENAQLQSAVSERHWALGECNLAADLGISLIIELRTQANKITA